MGLRDELNTRLPEGTTILKIDREANLNGLDALTISVTVPGTDLFIESTFSKANSMSNEHVANLVASRVNQKMRELKII